MNGKIKKKNFSMTNIIELGKTPQTTECKFGDELRDLGTLQNIIFPENAC